MTARILERLMDLLSRLRPLPKLELKRIAIEAEDDIYWYYSPKERRAYPIYIFGGDTDMATEGKVSLTSLERNEVVLTLLAESEGPLDYDLIEARVNARLGRKDLRTHRHREIPDKPGWYEPLDLFDPQSPVKMFRIQSVAAYLRRGGALTEA